MAKEERSRRLSRVNGAMMGLMLHTKAKSLIEMEMYSDAVEVLAMAEEKEAENGGDGSRRGIWFPAKSPRTELLHRLCDGFHKACIEQQYHHLDLIDLLRELIMIPQLLCQ
ncbi:PREDICTED: uncharacterized protein LOC104746934 [Camelina sativa]|uniref:Uncharacterized protein LOC104746934 n=1 Tax=Camelina sativa TaxID=90675 RepID=A0ABM0W7G5_CAMSA|nr:PREDICTED: uncharacterized protein LOC104746934 [Camelina sativa]